MSCTIVVYSKLFNAASITQCPHMAFVFVGLQSESAQSLCCLDREIVKNKLSKEINALNAVQSVSSPKEW